MASLFRIAEANAGFPPPLSAMIRAERNEDSAHRRSPQLTSGPDIARIKYNVPSIHFGTARCSAAVQRALIAAALRRWSSTSVADIFPVRASEKLGAILRIFPTNSAVAASSPLEIPKPGT